MNFSFLGRVLLCIILVAGGGVSVWYGWNTVRSLEPTPLPVAQVYTPPVATSMTVPAVYPAQKPSVAPPVVSSTEKTSPTTEPALPKEWRLAVPFLSQAPKKDWSMPYQEACEEASMLMVQAYFAQRSSDFTPDEGDQAILDFVNWQAEYFGPEVVDLTVAQAADALKRYMPKLTAEQQSYKNIEQIKRALVAGYPVIIPADGKRLANPHFRNGGPRYHMLVVVGYLADGRWITNDPGTQFGKGFLYPQENLLESIHDWNNGGVPSGEPTILVVKPKTGK